jgi:hypothetical protein
VSAGKGFALQQAEPAGCVEREQQWAAQTIRGAAGHGGLADTLLNPLRNTV